MDASKDVGHAALRMGASEAQAKTVRQCDTFARLFHESETEKRRVARLEARLGDALGEIWREEQAHGTTSQLFLQVAWHTAGATVGCPPYETVNKAQRAVVMYAAASSAYADELQPWELQALVMQQPAAGAPRALEPEPEPEGEGMYAVACEPPPAPWTDSD